MFYCRLLLDSKDRNGLNPCLKNKNNIITEFQPEKQQNFHDSTSLKYSHANMKRQKIRLQLVFFVLLFLFEDFC